MSFTDLKGLWILSDSRSVIHHLLKWSSVGNKTVTVILKQLNNASSFSKVHLQCIPSHVDVWGNENADVFTKEGTTEALPSSRRYLELYSARRYKSRQNWAVPPNHPWYSADLSGISFDLNCDRYIQTTLSYKAVIMCIPIVLNARFQLSYMQDFNCPTCTISSHS